MAWLSTIVFSTIAIVGFIGNPVTGSGLLQHVQTGLCLLAPATAAGGLDYALTPCDHTDLRQDFNVMALFDYEIIWGFLKSINNDQCATILGGTGKIANGLRVQQWACNLNTDYTTDHFKWRIVNGNYGSTFQLQLKHSSKCLTPGSGYSYMVQQDCTTSNQDWRIIPSQQAVNGVCNVPML